MPKATEPLLLLDTHIWIWLTEGKVQNVAPGIPEAVERAAASDRLVLSAISWWELGRLLEQNRIRIAKDLLDWITATRRSPGARIESVSASTLLDAARLPDLAHKDPVDRILAATARELEATLVTCDAELIAYGKRGHVRVLDARPVPPSLLPV